MIIFRHSFITLLILLSSISIVYGKQQLPYHIYLDADFTTTKESALSIEKGIKTALAEHNYLLNNIPFKVIIKDHRGNSRRSTKHLKEFVADDRALALFGGLHSPVLLTNKSMINSQKILTLVPWAAAGPITRTKHNENWIFRLSIDDSKAGNYIVTQSLKQGFKRPYLLLENTGWGRSNQKTMSNTLKANNIALAGSQWFNWGIDDSQARIILHSIIDSKADVIFFVGNAPEGITFSKQLAALSSKVAMRSHWGITGGGFSRAVNASERAAIDLQFIQTRFSFVSSPQSNFSQNVFTQLTKQTNIKTPADLAAPTGFIHAYDLTKLLIAAINQAKLTGDRVKDRDAIRYALEHLETPVSGLIKRYHKPFSPYNSHTPDAHEALNPNDYMMGYYDNNNTIHLNNEKVN